ncbi:MAG: zf-HC2 domain-containing protein, partial [Ruminococcus sp.]|nr:zf-HC2 domain-containing protein [Ruminococcus sp.]
MSKNCEIVKDLLPLYADDVCTEESRKLVAEHIAHCSECRAELEKMGKHISVKAETDVNVMKRIRKRMRIEKITVGLISLAVVLGIGIFALLYMVNTLGPMDVLQMSIGEDVRAEVDENGELTLILKDYAATEDYLMPIMSDENGKYMGIDKDFDASKKEGFGVSLMQRK